MDMIRYAVVGAGALGRHHARWAADLPGCRLTGVYDLKKERAEEVAAERRCRACASLEDLLTDCDAVSLAVSTSAHAQVALRIIEAGKHLLIEKPIAATLNEADAIISAAHDRGVKLMVGHIERFNPALLALEDYDIDPRFIEAHRLAAFNPRGADVAVVLDLMIHDIDLALHLMRSPLENIAASAVAVVSDSEDIANARLTFANGAVANLTASRISLRPMRKLRLFQTSGYFSLDLAARQADLYRLLSGPPRPGEVSLPIGSSGRTLGYFKAGDPNRDMLQAELEAFIHAIRYDRSVPVSGEEGRQALAVALAIIIESQRTADGTHEQ